MKIEEIVEVFLNSANFMPDAFLILAPPSGYALNLKSLIKVSNVSWTSQLYMKYVLERKFDKTNFISPKKTPPKSPCVLGFRDMESPQGYLTRTMVVVLRGCSTIQSISRWLKGSKPQDVHVILENNFLTPYYHSALHSLFKGIWKALEDIWRGRWSSSSEAVLLYQNSLNIEVSLNIFAIPEASFQYKLSASLQVC